MEKLTEKQQRVLQLIVRSIRERGYPPTLKDLAEALGVSSRNTAVKYLAVLARKGYIVWERNKARGIQLVDSFESLLDAPGVSLPLVGSVTAGVPMLAEENIDHYVMVPRYLVSGSAVHYLLRVQGDSMAGAGILDGDLVVVRSQSVADVGAIVVALLGGSEATVKRLMQREGRRFLQAENPRYADIYPEGDWSIQGRVVALVRESVE
ncbi:MAG TPA: transcriptional repressor LexA [bacterium]|nr:transcriptional repressor LexA [bacterium]HNT65066.1 transcriptional repressor LexA [bacterium]HOX84473.1 transcriptional repressor LexA [bacterium]HPG45930.1 transcriptional repressor LexA [bacterium]HPM97752.1 transcriptional repressor LexA [bacterium]